MSSTEARAVEILKAELCEAVLSGKPVASIFKRNQVQLLIRAVITADNCMIFEELLKTGYHPISEAECWLLIDHPALAQLVAQHLPRYRDVFSSKLKQGNLLDRQRLRQKLGRLDLAHVSLPFQVHADRHWFVKIYHFFFRPALRKPR